MNCPCGGQTARRYERRGNATLHYIACTTCGRCGQYRLDVQDQAVAEGEVARRAYLDERVLDQIRRRHLSNETRTPA